MSKITKQNGNIAFDEGSHKYWDVTDNKKNFISVTTLIERYAQPFDSEYWSMYKALETLIPAKDWAKEKKDILERHVISVELLDKYKITEDKLMEAQQKVKDDWKANNLESTTRGTAIHAEIENSFYANGKNVKLDKFGIGGKFECRKDYTDLDIENGVYPEYLIHRISDDGILCLAGQIDLLVKQGNDIIIGDWKTNKEIKTKGFFDSKEKSTQKMKFPLNNLEECNLSHYNLQLSTYAWMLQKINPEFNIKKLFIWHIDHDGKETKYELPYLKEEVEKMLCHYKKELMKQKQREKYKPIIY